MVRDGVRRNDTLFSPDSIDLRQRGESLAVPLFGGASLDSAITPARYVALRYSDPPRTSRARKIYRASRTDISQRGSVYRSPFAALRTQSAGSCIRCFHHCVLHLRTRAKEHYLRLDLLEEISHVVFRERADGSSNVPILKPHRYLRTCIASALPVRGWIRLTRKKFIHILIDASRYGYRNCIRRDIVGALINALNLSLSALSQSNFLSDYFSIGTLSP